VPTVIHPSFLSEKEADFYLSVSFSLIRRWRCDNARPAVFRLGRVIRSMREALDGSIRKNTELVYKHQRCDVKGGQ